MKIDVPPGYEELGMIFDAALKQASTGKGKIHAGDEPKWTRQDTLGLIVPVARGGFLTGQAMKKVIESTRKGPIPAGREILGAINYLGALIYHISDADSAQKPPDELKNYLKVCGEKP